MIKNIIRAFLLFFIINANGQNILRTNKKQVIIKINDNELDLWRINSKIHIDRYYAFCWKNLNEAHFISDIDSIKISFKENDSIKIHILLNESDTSITELIGIREFPNNLSIEDRLYYLNLLYNETKNYFMNYENLNFNYDSLYYSCINEILQVKNDYDYYRILEKFIARIEDGHSQVFIGNVFRNYFDYVPIRLYDIKEKIYLISFRETLKDSLVLGSELISVNGIAPNEYLKKNIFPYISASTLQWKYSIGVNKICLGRKGDQIKLGFKAPNGKIYYTLFTFNGESTRYSDDGKDFYKNIGKETRYVDNLDVSFTHDSIAILIINKFYPKDIESLFLKRIKEIKNSKGLIIDLRNNTGGITDVAIFVLKHIVKTQYFLSIASECRINDGVFKALGYGYPEYKPYFENTVYRQIQPDTIQIEDSIARLKMPIVILINELTFSAAEDFLIMLYEIKDRPLLIGSSTGGSTGSPLVIPNLPYNGYAKICVRRCKFPYSGKLFINEGIKPDIEVYPSIEDLLLDNDKVLVRGINEVRKLINGK